MNHNHLLLNTGFSTLCYMSLSVLNYLPKPDELIPALISVFIVTGFGFFTTKLWNFLYEKFIK